MKKLLMLLLLVPLVLAQPTDWFKAGLVKTRMEASSVIELQPRGPNPFVESIRTDVIFVPQNSEFSAVRSFDATPSAIATGDRVRFEWRAPQIGKLSYKYQAIVETANNAPRVAAKIPYPFKVPPNLEKYVKPTQNIDSNNPKVLGQAYALAQGEDDLFLLVSKIAIWTKNNVRYNLSTLTADVSQPASWVLENRYGVCDEITGLFIAMLRALKIPAKFVSGIAFTNSVEFPQGWGAHGWAEVYFPGVGWVPFDPTFGEYGWVDPSHIKLKESFDPQEPTTVFEWKARDVDVRVEDLKLGAEKIDQSGSVPFELKLSAAPLRPRVGFGSFNGVVLNIENLADYYVGAEFSLSRVTDMTILDGESKQIALPPKGRGRLFWKVKVRENLDPHFQYELPIRIYTIRNDTVETAFGVGQWDIVFSQADIDTEITRLSATQRDPLQLACVLKDDMIWDDVGRVDCLVQNKGEKELPVKVCFGQCREAIVPGNSNLPVSFDIPMPGPGQKEVVVTASSGDLEKKAVLTLVRLEEPRIAIKDISLPERILYGDTFTLLFTLSRESISLPENVTVNVEGGGAKAKVEVGDLLIDQEVHVNIRSDQLYSGNPLFDIDVTYQDPFGQQYHESASASTFVSDVPWYKRFLGWFIDLF
ncbi:MAG: transglutaminase-like domain-containing protein [Candidatus Woesearchaeota archaeon]